MCIGQSPWQENPMLCRNRLARRPGATPVDCAVVAPITFLMILGLVLGAMGVFRYQEVATLAREGARWASVHGGQYTQEANPNTQSPPLTSSSDIYNCAIAP